MKNKPQFFLKNSVLCFCLSVGVCCAQPVKSPVSGKEQTSTADAVNMQQVISKLQEQIQQVQTSVSKQLQVQQSAQKAQIVQIQKMMQEQIINLQKQIQAVQAQLDDAVKQLQKELRQVEMIK